MFGNISGIQKKIEGNNTIDILTCNSITLNLNILLSFL